jgi:hypothetical protein
MNYFEDIFTEYKEGNDKQRLEIYMNHRYQRYEFDQIEDDEANAKFEESKQIVIEPSKTNNRQSFFRRMKRWCFTILS